MPPYFSVIIPAYNRERFIGRAIASCLLQDFNDFEIIVVDDASTDKTAEVVKGMRDPRIRVIEHAENKERLIARNTGAKAAKGQWIIWFDSDDEFVPGAFAVIRHQISLLPSDVKGLRFMCRLDSLQVSPDLPYDDETWDYEKYVRWIESHYGKRAETLPVVSRETVDSVLFPEDRYYTSEMQYHLDFALRYKTKTCSDILRIYHTDADNASWRPNIGRSLNAAKTFALRLKEILGVHGKPLEQWAPKTYETIFFGMITQLLLAGQRTEALRVSLMSLGFRPFSLRRWIILVLGMASPRLLAYAKAAYTKNGY